MCLAESARSGSEDHERDLRPDLGPLQPRAQGAGAQHAEPGPLQEAPAQRDHGPPCVHPTAAQPLHRHRQRQDAQVILFIIYCRRIRQTEHFTKVVLV